MSNQSNSDPFFKAVFNKTSMGLAVIDEHGLFIEVNHQFCKLFGYDVAELKGHPFLKIFPQTIQPEVAAAQHSIFHNQQSTQQTEWKGKTKEGSLIDLEITFDLFVDEKDGHFVVATFQQKRVEREKEFDRLNKEALINSTSDLEAKKAEHALKVNEEQLNLIYNSTAGIIFLLGVENNGEDFYFISMNSSGLETIGAKPEDIFNKPVREVIPEPSFSLVMTKYKEAIQTGKSVVWQEETPYPTGTKTGIVTVTPIYDNEGNCVRLVGSVNDITELKETERSLAISRQQYKSLFDQNPDAVYSFDLEGNFTDFNPGLEKLLECSRHDIIQAATFVPFCHPDDLEKTVNYFLNVQTGDAQNYDVRAITFTGKLKYLNIINMPIMVDGKITGVYGIAKDITSEKLALLQLEQSATQLGNSNIELERFAYIASHDLQEPLRMISGFLQLLEKKYQDSIDEKGREYIRFAVDGSLRMKHLIDDLLDYSSVSTSKQNLEKVDIDLVMNDVLQNLSLQIKEKQAVVKADGLPSLPVADKTQMVQLFQNLLSNALKYSSNKQPQIEIAAIEQEEEWLFSVKDNGIGFDEKFADKIFVIFHRLHNKSEYSGTGMGLAICKKIIDRHGGKICAKSAPEKGSTFWFTIKKHLTQES